MKKKSKKYFDLKEKSIYICSPQNNEG